MNLLYCIYLYQFNFLPLTNSGNINIYMYNFFFVLFRYFMTFSLAIKYINYCYDKKKNLSRPTKGEFTKYICPASLLAQVAQYSDI